LSDYLVLENLTQGLGAPCVMDIKIGARTYGPDASEAKKKQEDAKYQGTKVSYTKYKYKYKYQGTKVTLSKV